MDSHEDILRDFYEALATDDHHRLKKLHIPRSEVFYVRKKYYLDTGIWVSLDRMERSMYLEGMLDAHDVLEPERKRDWE